MRKPIVMFLGALLFAVVLSAGGWWLFRSQVRGVPAPQTSPSARVVARITAASQISSAPNSTAQPEPPFPQVQAAETARFMPKGNPLKEFDQDLKNALLSDLALSFRELQTVL